MGKAGGFGNLAFDTDTTRNIGYKNEETQKSRPVSRATLEFLFSIFSKRETVDLKSWVPALHHCLRHGPSYYLSHHDRLCRCCGGCADPGQRRLAGATAASPEITQAAKGRILLHTLVCAGRADVTTSEATAAGRNHRAHCPRPAACGYLLLVRRQNQPRH